MTSLFSKNIFRAFLLASLGVSPLTAPFDLWQKSARAQSATPDQEFFAANKKISKQKTYKKKSKSPRVDDFGPMDVAPVARGTSDLGIGIHREQEGVDRPYSAEIATSSNSVISVLKGKNGDSSTSTNTIDTELEASMIMGMLQLGINLFYLSQEITFKSVGALEESKTSRIKLGGGPIIKFNFANLDTQLSVPFVYAGVSYVADELKTGASDTTNLTGTIAKVGGGIHLFLDSNVTFAPKIEYYAESLSGKAEFEQNSKGLRGLLQLGVFL